MINLDENKNLFVFFSFETSGDYTQHIQFTDAENYLTKNTETRREYPLVLILHSLIEENSQEFFRTVNIFNIESRSHSFFL
jgi:hypothetical protein